MPFVLTSDRIGNAFLYFDLYDHGKFDLSRSHEAFYLHKSQSPLASADFYPINIFVQCERNFGYLLLLCHKPLEAIVFNPQFYKPLKSIKLS